MGSRWADCQKGGCGIGGSRRRTQRFALEPDEERWLAEYEQHQSVRFGWHTLRHTFCTHLAMTGTPVVKIQRWAGHADLATTQRYMHWAPSTDDVRHIDALDRPSAQVLQLA
jgi:integrase